MDKAQQTVKTSWVHLGSGMAHRREEGPMSVAQAANARREAEYVARRNGLKEPLLQLWKVMH